MRRVDISGERFGTLTAIAPAKTKKSSWICSCDCGKEAVVVTSNLRSGNTKSCGWCEREKLNGMYGTPEFCAFKNAKNRCERKADPRYKYYGGRGIEFRFTSFAEFLGNIGPRPSKYHSLDRINVDDHYRPGNVRWATLDVQRTNKQNSLKLEIGGETRPLKEWCVHFNQPYKRVWERIKSGMSYMDALTRPAAQTVVHVEPMGAGE